MNVVLLGKRQPNVRSLFAQNEQGLAIDIGDRNGASEAKRTWRRNLLGYSEQLDNAYWTLGGASVSANTVATTDPNGGNTADKLVENAALIRHEFYRSITLTPEVYTFSVYAKAAERSRIAMSLAVSGGTVGATFDLTGSGSVVATDAGASANFTSVGNGWFRCWVTVTGTAVAYFPAIRLVNTGTTTNYTGDGSSGAYFWGMQLDLASTPSTYQPITDFNTEFKAAYPNHSLYVDSNGVAPAVYPGDQVGLVIDSSRGGLENLGAELVTNGGFDSDTWWSKSTNVTISGGLANYNTVALNNGVFRSGVVAAGKYYQVTFTVSGFSSGGVRVYTGGNRTSAFSANGTYRVFCLAGSSDTQIIFEATSAGTVLALDNISVREIPGIHPYQTTSGSRPALCRTPDGGRRNLLTYSEDLSSAAWGKTSVTVTGTDTIVLSAGSAGKYVSQTITGTAPSTISFEAKEGTHRYIQVLSSSDAQHFVNIDLQTGTIGTTGSKAEGALIESLSGGWNKYRVTITNTGFSSIRFYAVDSSSAVYGASTSATTSWQMRKVQLETGSSATTYQKVTTTHDVTEASRRDCWGLMADGSDDSLITSSVDFSSTDKMTVMAGVRKNSDGLDAALMELTIGSTNGWFAIYAPGSSTAAKFQITSQGTTARAAFTTSSTWNAPVTAVVTGQGDISGDSVLLRLNGSQIASSVLDQGSGNYANSVMYILSRSASIRLSGILYTLIIRGAATPTGTIADFEKNLLRLRAGLGPF
jgi:hypothetical protein